MNARPLLTDELGDGAPLVLMPGGLTGWLSWVPHQQRLSAARRVLRVQPIHNELGSAGLAGDPGYDASIALESLRLTLDELGIARADLAGWSAGGKGLIDFAVSYPDRVNSLTLVEPAAHWILYELGEADEDLVRFDEFMEGLAGKQVTEDDLAIFFASAGFVSDPSEARGDPFWSRAWPHRMTLSWLSKKVMGSPHTIADLATLTFPVLLTKGTRGAATDRRVVDVLAERLPQGRVVELDGSHAHHIQSIDAFIGVLEQHLVAAA